MDMELRKEIRDFIKWQKAKGMLKDEDVISYEVAETYLEQQVSKLPIHGVSKSFAVATETTDDIVKDEKYEVTEVESMGYYIIDESGEETYYHHSVLNVC